MFLSLQVVLILANSSDPEERQHNEMQHDVAFYLGLQYLPEKQFSGFQYSKGQLVS